MAPEPEPTTRRSRKAAKRGGSTAQRRKGSHVLGPLLALFLVGALVAGGVYYAWPYLRAEPAQPDNLPYRVTVLGNGTPAGGPEEQGAYPTLAAKDLARRLNRVPVVTNYAQQSVPVSQLLTDLDQPRTAETLSKADLIVLQLGVEGDFTPPGAESRSCKDTSCWGKEKAGFTTAVQKTVDKVRDAAPGTPILLVGAWSLFPNTVIAAADQLKVEGLTNDVNTIVQTTANAKGAFYLDAKDNLGGGDPKYLLQGSGRLNDLGQKRLAEAVAGAVTNAGALKAKGTDPVVPSPSAPAAAGQGGNPVPAPAT